MATRDELDAGADACLYHGTPALAFTLRPSPHAGYRPTQAILDDGVAALTRDRLAAASQRMERGERPALTEFDLISDLTGLGPTCSDMTPAATWSRMCCPISSGSPNL